MEQNHVLKKFNFYLLTPRVGGGSTVKLFLLSWCCIRDSLKFDMQYDHVLKKTLNLDLVPTVAGSLRANYLLPCCCIRDSLHFDMQHDHVLKKLNFDLLNPGSRGVCGQSGGGGGGGGSAGKIFPTMLLHL